MYVHPVKPISTQTKEHTMNKFEEIRHMELSVQRSKNVLGFSADRAQSAKGIKADQAKLFAALDALTPDELKAYGEYRKAN